MHSVLLSLALLLQATGTMQPPATPGTSALGAAPAVKVTIAGLVMNDGAGTPLRKASVRLSSENGGSAASQISDSEGRFAFPNIAAGKYRIAVDHPAFISKGANRFMRNRGLLLDVSSGQSVSGLL